MTSTTPGRIYAAMARITRDIGPIAKRAPNGTGINFNHRHADDLYDRLNTMLAANEIFVTTKVISMSNGQAENKNGGKVAHAVVHMEFTYTATDGSFVTSHGVGESKDSGDKAFSKAQTYAAKNCHLHTFVIPLTGLEGPDEESDDEGAEALPAGVAAACRVMNAAKSMQELTNIKTAWQTRIAEGKFQESHRKHLDKVFFECAQKLNP